MAEILREKLLGSVRCEMWICPSKEHLPRIPKISETKKDV